MAHTDALEVVAARIEQALTLLLKYLADGIRVTHDQYVEQGYPLDADTPTFNANVRQYVRAEMAKHLDLSSPAPMSPLHFNLAPYVVKVLHRADGTLPRPRTSKREAFYASNDQALFSLNVTPPNGLVEIADDVTGLEEGALVMTWDSVGPELTAAELWRPSLLAPPGEMLDLFTATVVEAEEDLQVRVSNAPSGSVEHAATGTSGVGESYDLDDLHNAEVRNEDEK